MSVRMLPNVLVNSASDNLEPSFFDEINIPDYLSVSKVLV